MSEQKCNCEGNHEGHLCVLHSKGMEAEIARITDNPQVVCFTCGREANCADNVCVPMPIEKNNCPE